MKRAVITGRLVPVLLLTLATAAGLSRAGGVEAQTGPPVRTPDRVLLGPGMSGQQVLPGILDASPYLDEARLRLAALLPPSGKAGGAAVVAQSTPQYQVGDTKAFWAINFSRGVTFPYSQYKVDAECRAVGDYAYYFVEVNQKSVATDEVVLEFVAAFEDATPSSPRLTSKGIYEHVTEVFGDVPDVDSDPRIVVLLTDIPDAAGSVEGDASYAGYFYSANQSADPVSFGGGIRQRSNFTEIMYVDSQLLAYDDPGSPGFSAGVRNLVKGTIAHEFQHMVQWGNDPDETTAVNEGLSEYAAFICGYGLRSISRYVTRPNVDLFSWQRYGTTLDDYSRMALWTYYLGTRFGDDLILDISENPQGGATGISAVLESAAWGTDLAQVFNDFMAALYLDDPTLDVGQFAARPLTVWVEPEIHENLYPSSHSVALEPRGALVLRYWNGTDLALNFPDGLPSGVNATLGLKGEGGNDFTPVTGGGVSESAFGAIWREAALVLTNGTDSRTAPFRVEATAAQGDTGLVRYENGRPMLRIETEDPAWKAGLRITPEIAPAKITGLWYYLMGSASAVAQVDLMQEIEGAPGQYEVIESPIFNQTIYPDLDEGWFFVPVPDPGGYSQPGYDYMVSLNFSENLLGYEDLTRGGVRSFLRRTTVPLEDTWQPLSNFIVGSNRLSGNWMIRAEFTYMDTTDVGIELGLIQHPLFPEHSEVFVAGTEPLHPGTSSGTFTQGGAGSLDLAFRRTLGAFGLIASSPAELSTGSVTLDVTGFDRYGGNSDIATLEVSVATVLAGQSATLVGMGAGGGVVVAIGPGSHDGGTLTLVTYPRVPDDMPGAPGGAVSAAGAPVVSLGPTSWRAGPEGADLSVPVDLSPADYPVHFEQWLGGSWQPVPGEVVAGGGTAVGRVPGGGWYRLAEGSAPALPVSGARGVEVLGNAPNPFNPETRIRFRLSNEMAGSHVRLVVLNVRGQRVKTLTDGPMGPGYHEVTWDGRNESGQEVATGIYLYRLEVGSVTFTRKMLLLR